MLGIRGQFRVVMTERQPGDRMLCASFHRMTSFYLNSVGLAENVWEIFDPMWFPLTLPAKSRDLAVCQGHWS